MRVTERVIRCLAATDAFDAQIKVAWIRGSGHSTLETVNRYGDFGDRGVVDLFVKFLRSSPFV